MNYQWTQLEKTYNKKKGVIFGFTNEGSLKEIDISVGF
jgi:hypothetical protein